MLNADEIPSWARALGAALVGAGGARLLAVVLENRRLGRKDYRETMEGRIRDLERQVAGLFERVSSLRVEVAHLEDELKDERERSERLDQDNARLRARLLEVDHDRDPERRG